MVDRPTLSIVMPVYNERGMLREIVQRICAVDIPHELIVVDDASTDGTGDLLDELAQRPASACCDTRSTAAKAPPSAQALPPPRAMSSSSRTPTWSTTRPTMHALLSRSSPAPPTLLSAAVSWIGPPLTCRGALLGQSGHYRPLQSRHRPGAHRRGNLLQGVPPRNARAGPAAARRAALRHRNRTRRPGGRACRAFASRRSPSATQPAPAAKAKRSASATASAPSGASRYTAKPTRPRRTSASRAVPAPAPPQKNPQKFHLGKSGHSRYSVLTYLNSLKPLAA